MHGGTGGRPHYTSGGEEPDTFPPSCIVSVVPVGVEPTSPKSQIYSLESQPIAQRHQTNIYEIIQTTEKIYRDSLSYLHSVDTDNQHILYSW